MKLDMASSRPLLSIVGPRARGPSAFMVPSVYHVTMFMQLSPTQVRVCPFTAVSAKCTCRSKTWSAGYWTG